MKRIAILGSTGSIGTQALDVIEEHSDLFEAYVLTANNNVELLIRQARRFQPEVVVIANSAHYDALQRALSDLPIKVYAGADALCDVVQDENVDIVLASMVGFAGLRPTISAIQSKKVIALANKETLVVAGELITRLAAENQVPILPVDSEHSAIFQCLEPGNRIEKILLTASGGPFRLFSKLDLHSANKRQALAHPTWNMGAKITIDSATMMNKGFEVIEAKWLFRVPAEKIHVVVHPESVIHSMVEFEDGAVIAQLGRPDMRLPIALAMAYPERLPLDGKRLDFNELKDLSFFEPDREKFPCLQLAFDAIGRGGNIPCAMNAANEVAVAAYLKDRIGFYDIPRVISSVMEQVPFIGQPSLDDIFATHAESCTLAESFIGL